jgi:hypothetical protein
MNRRSLHHSIAALAVVWVLAFSAITPHSMVICAGHDGHVAIEPIHQDHGCDGSGDHCTAVSEEECGDCSDTPIFSYFGIIRLESFEQISPLIISPAFVPSEFDIQDVFASSYFYNTNLSPPLDQATPFGSIVLLC